MKKIVNKIHLYLGISCGFIILIISITGCIYCFQEELQNLSQPYRFAEIKQAPLLTPSQLKKIAEKALPGKLIHSVEYQPGRNTSIVFYHADPDYYYTVYINPYNGKVEKVKNMDEDFFRIILMGHYYLWLPPDIGKPIVATVTLIFLVLVISGIILWWPKNRNARKQRFTIKWSAKWRRKNYDLHNVTGFYISWLALCFAITGLIWGFQWFSTSVYWVASGGNTFENYSPSFSDTTKPFSDINASSVDLIWLKMQKEHPDAVRIEVHYPEDKISTIAASTNVDASTYWKNDFRYFDQHNLKEVNVKHIYGRFSDKLSGADKLMKMNYDIHTGGIAGLPGKCLAFFASLLCASLPITGFLIWWGRNKKTRALERNQPERII